MIHPHLTRLKIHILTIISVLARVWNLHFHILQVREETGRTFRKEYLAVATKMLHVLYPWPHYSTSRNLFDKDINSHHQDVWPKRFTAALFITTTKKGKCPKYLSSAEQNVTSTVEYSATVKKNGKASKINAVNKPSHWISIQAFLWKEKINHKRMSLQALLLCKWTEKCLQGHPSQCLWGMGRMGCEAVFSLVFL